MSFVQFSKVSLAFGDRDILKDVSINLQTGSKVALTGANGAGKSTLIKVLAGITKPDSGDRAVQKDCRIAYLPQSGLTHHGCTLREEADKAFEFGYEMQRQIDDIGEQLKSNPANTDALVLRQSELITELDESGWHRRQVQAESVLLGLGFERKDFERNTEEFSGGWQMRIALAKALMQNPDILLLDEPTNYLDIEARNWLEGFLKDFKGGFLLVSHDRYFLDVTINEVMELFNGELKRYPGNFTHYEKVREVELKTLISEYEQQQQEINKLEDFIKRFGYKATKAAQAQEYQKKLDKIIRIEIPESLKKIHFKFPPAPHSGRLVLRMNNICKSYDGKTKVIDNLELTLENGDRLVVAGRNGAGKSTLLRIIAEQDKNFTGEIIPGAGVQIGYFSQDNAETIKGSESILDYLEARAPLELIPKLRDMLGSFLFRGDDVYKSLDMLSGGEKARIALLQLLLSPVNLLVLDEPTNHLDIHSKDVLLQAMKDFGGTVVFVSHDRGFIEQLATKVLELTPGKFKMIPGDYQYYMEQKEKTEGGESLPLAAAGKPSSATPSAASDASRNAGLKTTSDTKLSWEEQKKRDAEKRKIEKEVERLEKQIEELEAKKAELDAKMGLPEVYSNGEKAKAVQHEIDELVQKINETTLAWEEASEKLC
ncbi:MAG: ABC-F family ATP-binding cassette domain-containing protein [Treponema sp.]|nr:ABC-F family ATP-binding cassette domain-containing protein [Spirochaetia bacterium]MDY2839300.1 ABC-F family ATP-binding cassette domain-containing protein [Treponema sp.]MDY5122495.1 ABC-F family ATP-binding cassette domain-containing protein [Treponema sp.]